MKGILQTFSSLIIAVIILLSILFLPETKIKPVTDVLNYFSKATKTIFDLGSNILTNFVAALIVGLVIYLLIQASKKYIDENENDEEKEDINTS